MPDSDFKQLACSLTHPKCKNAAPVLLAFSVDSTLVPGSLQILNLAIHGWLGCYAIKEVQRQQLISGRVMVRWGKCSMESIQKKGVTPLPQLHLAALSGKPHNRRPSHSGQEEGAGAESL